MPYNKTDWKDLPDVSTPINAARLNKLETQYEEAVSDATAAAASYTDTAIIDALPAPQAIAAADRARDEADRAEDARDQAEAFSSTVVELQDSAAAALVSTPSETQSAVDERITSQVTPLVSQAIADDPTVAAAAADAVTDAVVGMNFVQRVEDDADDEAGLIGENARKTDLVVRKSDGRVPDRVLTEWKDRMGGVSPGGGSTVPVKPQRGLIVRTPTLQQTPYVPTIARIEVYGDSLVEGQVPDKWPAADAFPGRLEAHTGIPTLNGGVGGDTAGSVAMRAGVYVALFSVSGASKTIPASGTARIMLSENAIGWRDDVGFLPVQGTLTGSDPAFVPRSGTLQRNLSGGTLLFTPTDGVTAATPAPGIAEFQVTQGTPDPSALRVIMFGRNDVLRNAYADTPAVDRVIAAVIAFIEHQASVSKRIAYLGVINGTNEPPGTDGYGRIKLIEAGIKALYPEFWVPLRDYIVSPQCYLDQGLPVDTVAVSEDRPGGSLMVDTIHWTKATANVAALFVRNWLTEKGWI